MINNPPDIAIVLILGLFAFNGFRHGFIEEMGRLISLIGGFILASKFHNLLIPYLQPYIDGETLQVTAAYLGVFVVSVIVITIIAKILQKFIELVLLGWLNRLLGPSMVLRIPSSERTSSVVFNPVSPREVSRSPWTSFFCASSISLRGRPFLGLGIKCQSMRSLWL